MDFGALLHNPTFWVGISFIMFIALLLKLNVHGMIGAALDKRADGISRQLDEARTLKEEAKALLAQFERKQRDARQEAEDMLVQAKEDSELFAKEAEVSLDALVERRIKAADEKITQAETAAVGEVRGVAVQVAVAAARQLMSEGVKGDKADTLVDKAIKDLGKQLH